MKTISGIRRRHGRGRAKTYISAPAVSPQAELRLLAEQLHCDGTAALTLHGRDRRRLARILRAVRRMAACGQEADAALQRLAGEARQIEACARVALREGGIRLPGSRGRARVMALASAMLRSGERSLTEEGLKEGVRAFDEAQPLEQRELWAVPEALRIAIVEACVAAAESIVRSARAGEAARRWARRPVGSLRGRGADFYERALMICNEEGLADARALLERRIGETGRSPERFIRQAHDARAYDLMRLDNLMAARRMVDALNWQDCFDELSAVEAELRRDPSGVYPLMDDASRLAVRDQVGLVARRTGIAEQAVARHAVAAAREACPAGHAGCSLEALSHLGPVSPEALRGSACWWLYDDEGRRALLERMDRQRAKLTRIAPDPSGVKCMAGIAALAATLFALLMLWLGGGWLWPAFIPLAWTSAGALAAAIFPRLIRPAQLLKLEIDPVPDAWRTLVVTPVLISDIARAESVCDGLEALGRLERDANIEYLLLGDFADAEAAEMPGDAALLGYVRGRIAGMNARAGAVKYHFLHRPRTLYEPDARYMGRDRKRGALMDLNRLLLGADGAETAFLPCDARADLKGRFRYVITLDADTRMLPGTVRRLIGAMAHPMNRPVGGRGWAVMQPRMELMPSACVNGFVRLFAGAGGVDTYPVSASSLWMDMTGVGVYAGKGIYDVAAFHAALEGALPEGRVLSHDLIEGAIARSAFLGDVALYDGCPLTLNGWTRRAHRWTRGDWQLLPILLRRGPLPNGRRLHATDRFRMADNLLRSLRAPALWFILTVSAWRGDVDLLAAGMLVNYLNPLLNPFGRDALGWRRATAELAVLPQTAFGMLDAALRALWRLYISGRHLLDWVPSAEPDCERRKPSQSNRLAAVLLLPGLMTSGAAPLVIALGAIFWVGADWLRDMERRAPIAGVRALTESQREALSTLARDTWRFFERCVPLGEAALPPDNVQYDPPASPARRTSPTNIGLYMLSCVASEKLGFIDRAEVRARLGAALDAVDRTQKWRGHLFNWIDIDTLQALRPRYVSSVDSGNLAACAIACAQAVRPWDAVLAERLDALAGSMDFKALYDPGRELFTIGMDVDAGLPGRSHYDLLASEARTLSYVAIMLGQVPARHWRRLGRGCTAVARQAALMSWSGTMFEYLMPEILLRSPALSLVGSSCLAAVDAQAALGYAKDRPWGVSESGYHAFDMHMNYQYRAFGLRQLALSGRAINSVVAPYASALALAVRPWEAAENLARMQALGWRDDCGLYEAADYRRPDGSGEPSLVKSHMAHHQGMVLCAICNALTGDALSADFMGDPRARALSLLLEERACPSPRRGRREPEPVCPERQRCAAGFERTARAETRLADVHLLRGRETRAVVTADGGLLYARNGIDAARFSGDLTQRYDASCVHLLDVRTGRAVVMNGEGRRAGYDAGAARFGRELGDVRAELQVSLSPEDDTLYRQVRLTNAGDSAVRLRVLDVVPVALARTEDWRAHPAFQNMFVESAPLGDRGLVLRRRPRNPGEHCPALVHTACAEGTISRESDLERLLGRTGDARRPRGIDYDLSGTMGAVLDPVSALCAEVEVAPGGTARLYFAMKLIDEDEDIGAWLTRSGQTDMPDRAAKLNRARTEAMLGYIGVSPDRAHRLDRLTALLLDARLAAEAKAPSRPAEGASRDALWALGLSGDRPILTVFARDAGQEAGVRSLIQAHAFYRAMGFETDLVLVDDGEADYARPCREMMTGLIAANGLGGRERVPGGVWLIDGSALSEVQRGSLVRASSAVLDAALDFDAQLRGMLNALEARPGAVRTLNAGGDASVKQARFMDNGYGGFGGDGSYVIDVAPGHLPPAPWSDLLARDATGILLTERGGGFLWHGNSRSGRLTAWHSDALREGWGVMLYLYNARSGELLRLLPGDRPALPFHVRFLHDRAVYAFEVSRLAGETTFFIGAAGDAVTIDILLTNRSLSPGDWRVVCFVDWLMGTDVRDAVWRHSWAANGACFAVGVMPGVGWLASSNAAAIPGPARSRFIGKGSVMLPEGLDGLSRSGDCLSAPVAFGPGATEHLRFAVGWAESAVAAQGRARAFADSAWADAPRCAKSDLVIETPDEALNLMANRFLPHQVRASRVVGRTGLYQPGGAYGFRDQLQDMLALIPSEPERVRAHLLDCAARQFEAGDVLHWWHAPYLGVRTRIADDRLFLPFVAAAYVRQTGDHAVLEELIPYLEDVCIPEGREDIFCEMRPGGASGTLNEHCMRAFRVSDATGEHGLALMGAGDWNDGMNRVGARGRGESVWLSQFIAYSAEAYAGIAPDAADRDWLMALAARHRAAVEAHGWDGAWYRRAYMDDGTPLGSATGTGCRIDLIAQAWAVLSGLQAGRCRRAFDAAWDHLVDEARGIIRLLDPPFEADGIDPGYIRGYPAGVRENGAQYTHGACWFLLALIEMGDAERAHRALRMLLPPYRADTPEKARRYRVEPYVTAADIYAMPGHEGRGGWTWYTGSAAWLYVDILALLGYERRGDRVRLNALLHEWPRASVTLRFGGSTYRLVCDRDVDRITLDGRAVDEAFIRMADDGNAHVAHFPPRRLAEH